MNFNNLYIAQVSFLKWSLKDSNIFWYKQSKCKPKHWPGTFLVEISIIKVSVWTVSTKSGEILCLAHKSIKVKEISKLCLMYVLHTEKIKFLNMEKYNSWMWKFKWTEILLTFHNSTAVKEQEDMQLFKISKAWTRINSSLQTISNYEKRPLRT